jgi:hypothetical protein
MPATTEVLQTLVSYLGRKMKQATVSVVNKAKDGVMVTNLKNSDSDELLRNVLNALLTQLCPRKLTNQMVYAHPCSIQVLAHVELHLSSLHSNDFECI